MRGQWRANGDEVLKKNQIMNRVIVDQNPFDYIDDRVDDIHSGWKTVGQGEDDIQQTFPFDSE
jgi:hypothetical protein